MAQLLWDAALRWSSESRVEEIRIWHGLAASRLGCLFHGQGDMRKAEELWDTPHTPRTTHTTYLLTYVRKPPHSRTYVVPRDQIVPAQWTGNVKENDFVLCPTNIAKKMDQVKVLVDDAQILPAQIRPTAPPRSTQHYRQNVKFSENEKAIQRYDF